MLDSLRHEVEPSFHLREIENPNSEFFLLDSLFYKLSKKQAIGRASSKMRRKKYQSHTRIFYSLIKKNFELQSWLTKKYTLILSFQWFLWHKQYSLRSELRLVLLKNFVVALLIDFVPFLNNEQHLSIFANLPFDYYSLFGLK